MPCVPCSAFELYHIVVPTVRISIRRWRLRLLLTKQRLFTSGTLTNTLTLYPYSRKTLDMEGFRHLSYRHFRHVFSAHCSNQTTANKNWSQMIDINLLFQLVHCNPILSMWLELQPVKERQFFRNFKKF